MHAFGDDTSAEALRVQFAALRRMSRSERLAMADDLTRLVRSLAWEGVKRRHPDATEPEWRALFAELVLGKALARRVSEHRRDTQR
jgi:hypothetical protein